MEKAGHDHVGAILLAVFSGLTILFLLAGGAFMLAAGFDEWQTTRNVTVSLLPSFLYLAAFLFSAGLIARGGLLALRQIQNKPMETMKFQPLSIWLALALFGGWILSIVMAVFLHQKTILQWFSLPFYLLAIGLPVYGLIRLGIGGLLLGSKLRGWSALSAGMTLAPFLAILGEGLVAVVLIAGIAIFLSGDPQKLAAMKELGEQLKDAPTQEMAIELLGPYLTNPLALVGGLFFLSLVTPLVEEVAKSLPVWMAWRRLESPAQGFALGALSGAGFGLMEGLFISANPGDTWGMTLAVRAASSAMHIITSGIIGWGIGIAAQQKRALPALGRYILGISIHGIWNACVVIMVYASVSTLLSGANPNIFAALIVLLLVGFLGLLILAAPIILWAINHQLRKSLPAPPVKEVIEPPQIENVVI